MSIRKERDKEFPRFDAILRREIRKVLPAAEEVAIAGASEVIYAIVDGILFTCEVGSDDDEFYFKCAEQDPMAMGGCYEPFHFPLPDDYIGNLDDIII